MRLSPSRAALTAITATAMLGTGAASAQAAAWSPFGALSKATPAKRITLSDAFSIKPGSVRTSSTGAVVMKNATVQVGALSGTGVTATATEAGVRLSGGTFVGPTSITDNTLKSSSTAPLTVAYSTTAVTAITGELTSTKTAATEQQLDQAVGPELQIPVDAVPAAPSNAPWTFKLGVDLQGLTVKASAGYASLDGRIYWTGGYRFGVALTGYPWNGGSITVGGAVTGNNIFKPLAISGLSGSITGPVVLNKQLTLLGGSVAWDAKGFTIAGTVRLQCSVGSIDASATGTLKDSKNFSFEAKGLAGESGCTLGQVAQFDEESFAASLSSTDGVFKYDASFKAAKIELFSKFITPDAEVNTYLSNVTGRIRNTCATCVGDGLQLTFGGTGVGQTRDWKRTPEAAADPVKRTTPLGQLAVSDRTSKVSYKLQATVNGTFDMNGAKLTKVSLRITNVKYNLFTIVQAFAMQHTLQADAERGFTA